MPILGMNPRIILHVDMDYFFAAVEEREHPDYKSKPVIVGADPKEGKGRGVVSTCNYAAREFGVRSGMPISRAWKLCPNAIYTPVNFELYSKVSSRIMSILRGYADKFEQMGIDEAFLDVSQTVGNYEEAKELAWKIKEEIFEKERLTCSIGIGPNKLVAKIASDFKKPNGLTVIEEKAVEQFLSPLPVGKLWGIGKKTEHRLNEMGIKTIADLAAYDPAKLIDTFGVWGTRFHQMAHGIDESEVEEAWEVKSVGRQVTLEQDTSDTNQILGALEQIAQDVQKEIVTFNFQFKTVTVKIRYEDFETHTHGKSLMFPTDSIDDLKETIHELVLPFLHSNKKVRLVGVRVSKLFSGKGQKTLQEF